MVGKKESIRTNHFNPLDYPICLEKTLREAPSTWHQHTPFGMFIIDLLRPAILVELGTYYGVSYCSFCQSIKQLSLDTKAFAVDTWRGDPQSGQFGDEVLEDLRNHHDPLYGSFSELIQGSFDEVVDRFNDGSIDLLHIDGYHEYEAVSHDFSTWLPKMSNRGIVMLHDTQVRDNHFGVWKLWGELASSYPSFELHHGFGLGLAAVGEEYPDSLDLLLKLSTDELNSVRKFFQALGTREELEIKYSQQEQTIRDIHIEIDNLDKDISSRDERIDLLISRTDKLEEITEQYEAAIDQYEDTIDQLEQHLIEKAEILEKRRDQVNGLENRVNTLEEKNAEKSQRLLALSSAIEEKSDLVRDLKLELKEKDSQIYEQRLYITDITSGLAWNIAQSLQRARVALAPSGSLRDRVWVRLRQWLLPHSDSGSRNLASKLLGARNFEIHENVMQETRHPQIKGFPRNVLDPTASLVIPVYNNLTFTEKCLDSIYRSSIQAPFEIIVVNNGSVDGTGAWIESYKEERGNLKVIHMPENVGFGKAINIGVQHSKGKYVVFLNNDTLVTKNWLDNIIAAFEKDSSIGIASPVTNYVGEGKQIDRRARKISVEEIDEYALEIQGRNDIEYEPNRLVFFCVVLKRSVIDLIGNIDTNYDIGNFEDDDYCVRARLAGFNLAIIKNSFVYHYGSATFKASGIDHTETMSINRRRFFQKVGRLSTALRSNPPRLSKTAVDVSVVIRTVDRPQLLRHALTSLANQTFGSIEAIVVNDGGPDVGGLIRDYKEYFQVRQVVNRNPGNRSRALNLGIQESSGKYLAHLDDDDILYPWHLEALFRGICGKGKYGFVYSDYNRSLITDINDPHPKKIVGAPPWKYDRDQLYIQNRVPIHCWLYTRKIAKNLDGFDENVEILEDYEFLIRVSSLCEFKHIPKVTCEYRFYLNAPNAIVIQRRESLKALKKIYDLHPTFGEDQLEQRGEMIRSLENQVKEIEELQFIEPIKSSGDVKREVIRLVTGL